MIEFNGKKLCENCFEEINSQPCPHCGFDPAVPSADPTVLKPGCILLGKYIIGRAIGKGGFGITYLAYDTTLGKKVAIKEFYPYGLAIRTAGNPTVAVTTEDNANVFKAGAERFYEEAKLVSRFNGNPNIVAVHEFFYENDTVYFAMEYLSGHTLKDHIQKNGTLNAGQALFIAQNVSNALMVAHSASVLHRDISPDNIMLCSNGEVKIIDFGAARQVMAERSQTFSVILKPGFAPLEQYQKKGKQGAWTDIYSLGATLYYALTGEIPDDPMSRQEEDSTFGENRFNINEELWDIIVRATMLRSSDRYQDIFELRRALDKVSFAPELIVPPTAQESSPQEGFRTAMPFVTSTATVTRTQAEQPAAVPISTSNAAPQEKPAGFFAANKKPLIAAISGTAAVAAAAVIIAVALNSGGGQTSDGMVQDPEYSQSSYNPLGDPTYSSIPEKTTAATSPTGETGTSPVEYDSSEPEKITSEPEASTPKPATTTTTKSTPKPKPEPEPEVTTPKPATTTTTKSTPKPKPKPEVTKPVTTTTTTAKPVVSEPEEVKEITINGETYSTDLTGLNISKVHLNLSKGLNDSDVKSLKYMKNLTYLDISDNNITDISFVKEMPKLQYLYFSGNNISDISAVKGLSDLKWIHGNDCPISDISALKGKKNLTNANFINTKITDLSPLADCTNLSVIFFNGSNIGGSLCALKDLRNLKEVYLADCGIYDISGLAGKKKLSMIALNNNMVSDVSPLKDCESISWLTLVNNRISETSIDFFTGLNVTDMIYLTGNGLTQKQADRIAAKINGSPEIKI
ncbi:MAG: protein kinase [Oscillospiraceae bacterium]|nr:protein kinase [Oscillospiraceae bacterium]